MQIRQIKGRGITMEFTLKKYVNRTESGKRKCIN